MEIKQAPSIGIQKFGVIYKQQSGGSEPFADIGGIAVKLKLSQRIKIMIKRFSVRVKEVFIKIRGKIYA